MSYTQFSSWNFFASPKILPTLPEIQRRLMYFFCVWQLELFFEIEKYMLYQMYY
jgi:hypothetical protein